tara:strand:- start:5455 stop:6177 length:723 start_codon:yes stop_codon:yes gene_type:complete
MKKNLSETIIGSGFIAKSFNEQRYELEKLNICLYAAGVSNSQTNDENLLTKDKNRIIDFSKKFDKKKKLVYISTCSIEDPSRNKNSYVRNKKYIEGLLREMFDKFLIIRLPEVVGKNDNRTSLINFLNHSIKNKIKFDLWKKAKRNVIDIEDVVSIAMILLKRTTLSNTKINIANSINYKVSEIVKNLEILNATTADYNLIDKGEDNWHIDISEVSEIIKNNKIKFDQNYLHKVLKKYYF